MSDDTPEEGRGRSKRVSTSKQKKRELLDKLRSGRNKYEVGELDNVYDEVDEREYTKKVLERQDDDWIVDDGGCGYVEDGREIFDDDLDEESISKSKVVKTGRKRMRDVCPDEKKGNVGKMLMNMPAKKKKEAAKIEEDDVLGDIIGQLGDSPMASSSSQSKRRELSAKDYLNSLASAKLKPNPIPRSLLPEVPKPIVETAKKGRLDAVVEKSAKARIESNDLVLNENLEMKSTNGNGSCEEIQSSEDCVEVPVKIKEEPIELDAFEDDFSETFGQAFDVADVAMAEPIEATAKVKEEKDVEIVVTPVEKPPLKDDFSEDWIVQNGENNCNVMNVPIDKSHLPIDSAGTMKFYYLDAHEEVMSQPGVVYLFGKVSHSATQQYVSCCVVVRNIQRQIFLLPRTKKFNMTTRTSTDEDVSMSDVYEEFNKVIAPKYKILEFKSKKVSKKFAFGKEDIPLESDYLEIRYSAASRALPSELIGETFCRVFGCRTSFLEILFLDRGIKGPCWLEIFNPVPNNAPCSWCKIEATCSAPMNVVVSKVTDSLIPPLVLMTIVPQAAYNTEKKQTEIVAIGCVVNTAYPLDKPPPAKLFNQHFCLLTKPSDTTWPFDIREAAQNFKKTTVQRVDSERALLNCFLTKLFVIDADIIVGHDLSGFGIDLLMTRLAFRKIPNWSRLGRLRRSVIPTNKFKSQLEKIAVTGRLVCDIKISAKELIRSRSYDLNTLCVNVLHFPEDKRPETNDEDFKYAYCSGYNLYELIWNLMSDASYILRMFAELNVLPLALQITNIAGNVMSRTLMGGRSERNEFLLLHAFHAKGYILPDKEFKKRDQQEGDGDGDSPDATAPKSSRKKPTYAGGLVLDPKVGFYDDLIEIKFPLSVEGDGDGDSPDATAPKSSRKKPTYAGGLVLDPKVGFYDDLILLMDFNSLYPSIIQEYNICFSTVPLYGVRMDESFLDDYTRYLPDESVEKGILPTEIRKLVESRRDVKKLLKNPSLSPELRMQYDIRQMALKLTANSMYGCLGFTYSRFFAKPLAAMITAKGREILTNTKRVVESYGYDVIYGDTDSIMINTKIRDFEQVFTIGRRIKAEVNKFYKQVELDIDGVFKYMLLLRKKKYAAVTLSKIPSGELIEKQEMKGIDIVRRDWCQLAGEAGKFVLKQILSNNSSDDKIENIHGYLETIRQDLEEGKVPSSLLAVTKQLTKAPGDYADSKALPHVLVALRMNSTSKRFKQGDTVSYITCVDGTSNPATQRSYHIEEIKSNPNLKVDIEYYLSQQIHPVIARLCDPIEGIDAASIARCLGLDPSKYKRSIRENNTELDENVGLFGKDDEERFKNCQRFSFKCENSSCGKENLIEHPMRKRENGVKELFLERCVNAECKLRPMDYLSSLQNQLHLKVRECILDFLRGLFVCEDPLCGFETNYLNPIFEGPNPQCMKCKRSQMSLEITPMHLYNQLVFYSKTFDLSRVTSKVTKFDPDTVQAFQKVHSQMEKVLNANKYSEVNLADLFSQLSFRRKDHETSKLQPSQFKPDEQTGRFDIGNPSSSVTSSFILPCKMKDVEKGLCVFFVFFQCVLISAAKETSNSTEELDFPDISPWVASFFVEESRSDKVMKGGPVNMIHANTKFVVNRPQTIDQTGSSSGVSSVHNKDVTETDMYLLNAIEKLAFRMDAMERRLRRTEELLVHVMEGSNIKRQDDCPSNFTRVARNCYHFSERQYNWKSAASMCKSLGSNLLEIESRDEFMEVVTFVQANNYLRGYDFWTGGLNPGLLWIWSNSARPVLPKKPSTRPEESVHGNGRCLKLAFNQAKLYQYHGTDCAARLRYICEHEENATIRQLKALQESIAPDTPIEPWATDALTSVKASSACPQLRSDSWWSWLSKPYFMGLYQEGYKGRDGLLKG
ncbi:hypothetical protein GE061_002344 [Apolygus lucorum]|uniref:DNA polymerase n=1 Tax=Apolygus lucorum TaxID=248454 RepID=A0A8S9X8V8_APOLU|nr:hypothetical protein GE061_002344 [Apolygus lucorum]